MLERALLAILLASPLPYKKRPLAKPRLLLCGHRFERAQQSSGRVDSMAFVRASFYSLNRLSSLPNAIQRSFGPSFAGVRSRHFAFLLPFFFAVPVLPLPALRRHACPPVSPGFTPGRRFCVLGANATGKGSLGPPQGPFSIETFLRWPQTSLTLCIGARCRSIRPSAKSVVITSGAFSPRRAQCRYAVAYFCKAVARWGVAVHPAD